MFYFLDLITIIRPFPRCFGNSNRFFFLILYCMNIHVKMRTIKTKHELFTAAQRHINFMDYY